MLNDINHWPWSPGQDCHKWRDHHKKRILWEFVPQAKISKLFHYHIWKNRKTFFNAFSRSRSKLSWQLKGQFHVLVDSTALVSCWSYDDFTLVKSLIPTTFALVISSGIVTWCQQIYSRLSSFSKFSLKPSRVTWNRETDGKLNRLWFDRWFNTASFFTDFYVECSSTRTARIERKTLR